MHRDFMTVVGGNVGSAKVNSLPALLFQNRLATLALDAAFQLLLALRFTLVLCPHAALPHRAAAAACSLRRARASGPLRVVRVRCLRALRTTRIALPRCL